MTVSRCTQGRSLKTEVVWKFESGISAAQVVQMHHFNAHLFTSVFVYKGRSRKKLLTKVQTLCEIIGASQSGFYRFLSSVKERADSIEANHLEDIQSICVDIPE